MPTLEKLLLKPFTPWNDWQINYPNDFTTLSRRQVMRIWKIVNYGEVSLCYTKFSGRENKDLYGHQLGELNFRYWE